MTRKIFFPNLDGLRFIAFFLVFWQHAFGGLFILFKEYGWLTEKHYPYFITGGYGVSFFFVLSGFLITYLLLEEIKNTGAFDIKAFYVRRILRIFPLYYLVLLWGFGLYPLLRYALNLNYVDNGNPLYYIFFLSNFDVMNIISAGSGRAAFIAITWSVAIEEQFYIVWAVLFFILSAKNYKYLFPILIVASTAFRFFNQDDSNVLYFHTFSVISDLAIGGGMAYFLFNNKRVLEIFSDTKRLTIITVYLFGAVIIWIYPSVFWLNQMYWLQRLIFSLFFAFVIAEQNFCKNSFYKAGNWKTISKLGIYSYGLYLLHPIVLYFVELGMHRLPLPEKSFAWTITFGIIGLILSIIVSYLSYRYFESYFLKLKKFFEK